jgi:hypothetical protein
MNTLPNQDHPIMYSDCLRDVNKLTIHLKSLWSEFKRFCIQNANVLIEAPLSDLTTYSGAEKFGRDVAFSNIDIDARRVSALAIYQHHSINK